MSVSRSFYSLPFLLIAVVLFMICIGACILKIPGMTIHAVSLFDVFFTATSAVCTSGLMSLDAATDFTLTGQCVLLVLIKLGSLLIILTGVFLFTRFQDPVNDPIHERINFRKVLPRIVAWTIGLELLGAIALYYMWSPGIAWKSEGERWFYSFFHSISTFNNAGFSLFENGMHNELLRRNYLLQWIFIGQALAGALGILSILDLFSPLSLRARLSDPRRHIHHATKIALYFLICLTIFGSMGFFLFEDHNAIREESFFGKVTTSIFHVVVSPYSGYSTLALGSLSTASAMLVMLLVFFGPGNPSGGGSTTMPLLAVLAARFNAKLSGKKVHTLYGSRIISLHRRTAYATVLVYLALITIGTALLYNSVDEHEPLWDQSLKNIFMTEVSAICTGGFAAVETSAFDNAGHWILMGSMLIGRVSIFIIAYFFISRWKWQGKKQLQLIED